MKILGKTIKNIYIQLVFFHDPIEKLKVCKPNENLKML